MSLSQWPTCHILNGHKESTSLFEAAVGLWHVEELSVRETPPLLPWIPARWDSQPGSWGLDAGCSKRAAAERVVGQAMLADQWTAGQKEDTREGKERKEERRNTKKKRKAGRLERKTKGVRGKAFFWIDRRRISQVRLSLTLSYLILRVTLRFLLIFRWLLRLPKEANLFLTFVYLIFVFPCMSCMLDIFCFCVLSSLRSSHQALLVFVTQSLVLVVFLPLYIALFFFFFFLFFFFFFAFPLYSWHFMKRRFVSLRVKQSSKLPGYILQSERRRAFQFSWCLAGDIWREEILSWTAML